MKSASLPALGNLIAWNSLVAVGDLSSIQAMLEKGELSCKDKLGKYELSPLHLAAWHNQPEICQFLISEKIPPNIREIFSEKTPLHIAAYFGHQEVAEILMNLEIRMVGRESVDILGCHPLHYAALGEKEKMLFSLLGLGHLIRPLDPSESFSARTLSCLGNTLDILIRKRNFALCDLVSSAQGISVVETNPRIGSALYIGYNNENPWTPFHSAAVLGEKGIVQMLLKKFPHAYCLSEEFMNLFDYSPGEVSLVEGHVEVAKLLGETRTIASCREAFNHFSILQNAPSYSKDLLKGILERDFLLMDKLLAEHGNEIFYQRNFYEDRRTRYREHNNLNAFSVMARFFCVSLAEWLKERKIHVSPQEFLGRDRKESVFFNWAMIDIHPYAVGFFEKISDELMSLRP